MENSLYIGLSQQMALRSQLDVTANNIANMNTPGYRAERMLFLDFLVRPDQPAAGRDQDLMMVTDQAVVQDPRPGHLEHTGNPLDVGLVGDGYLVVQAEAGQRYTRNGHLSLDAERQLVDINGLPVLDEGGTPITVPQEAASIEIGADGAVLADGERIGRLGLVSFADPHSVKPDGGSLLASSETPQPATDTRIAPGMIESSNVEPIVEMTQMIDILRKYQSAQELINNEHERVRSAIQKLGQVPSA